MRNNSLLRILQRSHISLSVTATEVNVSFPAAARTLPLWLMRIAVRFFFLLVSNAVDGLDDIFPSSLSPSCIGPIRCVSFRRVSW